jgi:hypothetical protein
MRSRTTTLLMTFTTTIPGRRDRDDPGRASSQFIAWSDGMRWGQGETGHGWLF